jgi:putative restriction endonuclease
MPAARQLNQYERAFRAWPILTETAADRTTITYGELARRLGMHWRPIRYVLEVIQDWCLREGKPPLTILVVDQRGVQGEGFIAWDLDNLEEGYEQVYDFPWATVPNPFEFAEHGTTTPADLAGRIIETPEAATEVYTRVRDRGIGQMIFRLALLDAYDGRCAFCGLSLTPALRAAHIIPWGEASPAERIQPANGLLLCSTHHDLFDAGILSVSADLRIVCRRKETSGHRWNDADRRAALLLEGEPLALPTDERHRLSQAALAYLVEHPRG